MERSIRVSQSAQEDLDDIWFYIALDKPQTADRFVDLLVVEFAKLAASPGIGRKRNELAEGIYSFPFRYYVIFYRQTDTLLEIVRVIHGARDLRAQFQNPQGESPDG